MKIGGLQKTTLLDFPGRIACTVFLSGCNLRCPFCHNAGLVLPEAISPPQLSEEEFFSFLESRRGKLDGVCVTGGEPTLYPDLPEFLRAIRERGFQIKLDTNGTNPHLLRHILEQGLADYVAMDIKNSPSRYAETCGGMDLLAPVRESARLLLEGRVEYEFRTTAVHPYHTPEDLREIGRWLRGAKQYFLQNFVDSGHLVGHGVSALSPGEMEALRQAVLADIPSTRIRGA